MVNNDSSTYMLSVEEARSRILSSFHALETEIRPILESLGQVLSEDIKSELDIPPLANSAMDGYAVRHQDILGASSQNPRLLDVTGYIAAGQLPTQQVQPGTAMRIMTGAPIPQGSDTVVPFEETNESSMLNRGISPDQITTVHVLLEIPESSNIRPAAQDIRVGQLVLSKGTIIRPAEIGVLASLGLNTVAVIRRPIVAIIATGDELVTPGSQMSPGKIFDSNSYGIYASVLRYGGIPYFLGIANDDMESLKTKLDQGLGSDMILTSAGVSKGDYDIVKDVITSNGKIDFWSVRMRPAKPLAFGTFEGQNNKSVPLIGLPGNPVSALVAFEQLVRPCILKMQGQTQLNKPTIKAILEEDIINHDGRRVYARAVVTQRNGSYYARLTGDQGSGILTSMAYANGLAICDEHKPAAKAGDVVDVQMLDWPESASNLTD